MDVEEQEECAEFYDNLIEKARTGAQSKFELLLSWGAYRSAILQRRALGKVVGAFCDAEKRLYKAYLHSVAAGESDIQLILSLKDMTPLIAFYDAEYRIVDEAIEEYKTYLWHGHLLSSILGEDRAEEDQYDHRAGHDNERN